MVETITALTISHKTVNCLFNIKSPHKPDQIKRVLGWSVERFLLQEEKLEQDTYNYE
ncbi:unnamed protein product [Clavelina lepadiformis]|uniref:Uncharacterized protein n=1 Tax=Clavelina lepadiformis TaxID=159417 RepID=A0ABP0GAP2_CLALP